VTATREGSRDAGGESTAQAHAQDDKIARFSFRVSSGVAYHVAGMLESGGGVEQGLKLRIVGGILSEPDGVGSHVRPPSRLSQYEAIRHREEKATLAARTSMVMGFFRLSSFRG